jgi:hypothetical protein
MNNLPLRASYRNGSEKITEYDLMAVHEKARQFLLKVRSKKPQEKGTRTK